MIFEQSYIRLVFHHKIICRKYSWQEVNSYALIPLSICLRRIFISHLCFNCYPSAPSKILKPCLSGLVYRERLGDADRFPPTTDLDKGVKSSPHQAWKARCKVLWTGKTFIIDFEISLGWSIYFITIRPEWVDMILYNSVVLILW